MNGEPPVVRAAAADPMTTSAVASPPEPPPGEARRNRTWLRVSVAVIVAWWIVMTVRQLTHPAIPHSVSGIAVSVTLRAIEALVVAWLLLRLSGESLADLGLTRRGFGRSLAWGALVAVGAWVVINVGVNSLLANLFRTGGTPPILRELFRNPADLPAWIVAAVVGGGFHEELKRAFALSRFERLLGRPGLVVALVIDSIVFGLGHLYQGWSGAASAGVTGLICAFVYLRRRRVVDAMIVHALFDLLGIAVAYLLYAQRS